MPKDEDRELGAQEKRRRLARAAILWGGVALSGTVIVGILTVWHLVRRGRLLRAGLSAPKAVGPLVDPAPGDAA